MRDETIATTNVQHVRFGRQRPRNFECHVIRARHLSPPPHAFETPLNRGEQFRHYRRCSNGSA
jgi:hypothetical protein